MLKRYFVLGILVITVALLISAFTLVRINRANSLSKAVLVDKGERDSLPLVFTDKGERDSLFSASSAVTGSDGSHYYEYGPAIFATGFAKSVATSFQGARFYKYGPAILATGFASPAQEVSYGKFPNVPWWH
jgi:hypothetical protein